MLDVKATYLSVLLDILSQLQYDLPLRPMYDLMEDKTPDYNINLANVDGNLTAHKRRSFPETWLWDVMDR